MPKGVPFAENMSQIEYDKLVRERPWVTTLYKPGDKQVNYQSVKNRLANLNQPITNEERSFLDNVQANIEAQNERFVDFHQKRLSHSDGKQWEAHRNGFVPKFLNPNTKHYYSRNKGHNIYKYEFHDFSRRLYYPSEADKYSVANTRHHGLLLQPDNSTVLGNMLGYIGFPGYFSKEPGHPSFQEGVTPRVANLFKEVETDLEQTHTLITSGIRQIDNYHSSKQQETARPQESARQRQVQQDAAKASYDKALAFKTAEFNKATASQKAEFSRIQAMNISEADKALKRQNATHQQEYNALKHQFNVANSGNAQNIARLSKQLEETNNLFRKQTEEFSAFRISQKQQEDNYKRQLQARAKDEQAKKEEAIVLRKDLQRRITLSETAGANLHFVNLNTKSDQSSGVTAFVNSGGRYVGSKAKYTPKGRLRINNTLSGTQTPDLYLSMFREKVKK